LLRAGEVDARRTTGPSRRRAPRLALDESRQQYSGPMSRLLHVLNGDCTRGGLERSGVPLEHDLFDQLLLIRHLHWMSTLNDRTSITFSLICIDSSPGVEHFTGLGRLRPEQLATLLDVRARISEDQIAVGQTAWDAYCAPEPLRLQQWLNADTAAVVASGFSRTSADCLSCAVRSRRSAG
jgi:hypothetical protein